MYLLLHPLKVKLEGAAAKTSPTEFSDGFQILAEGSQITDVTQYLFFWPVKYGATTISWFGYK